MTQTSKKYITSAFAFSTWPKQMCSHRHGTVKGCSSEAKGPPNIWCYNCIRERQRYCVFLASPFVLVYIGHFEWPLIGEKVISMVMNVRSKRETLRHHSSRTCRCDWPPLRQEIEEERRGRKGVISQAKLPKGQTRVFTRKSEHFLRNKMSIYEHVNACHRVHD